MLKHITVPNIQKVYKNKSKSLKFAIIHRNPMERALSHYCMFAPSITFLKHMHLTGKLKIRYIPDSDEQWLKLLYDMYPYVDRRCRQNGWGRKVKNKTFEEYVFWIENSYVFE